MHPDAGYWDHGDDKVPWITGAQALLDGADIEGICAELGIAVPFASVLDIGCGTGRAARLVLRYRGLDIAPSCVRYCLARGIDARLIEGAGDVAWHADQFRAQWVLALSLFTHMSRLERLTYLAALGIHNDEILADIIPGDGSGGVPLWTASVSDFFSDLRSVGFTVAGSADRIGPDGTTHRYVWGRR